MIEYTDTTVFNVGAQTIVNTVNCVGVMGAGIALEFRLRFPEMYLDYVHRCERNEVKVGRPYLYTDYGRPWILNFPTKIHWKYPSKLEWIEQGLDYFVRNYENGGILFIAFPKLGSDKGKLDWNKVQPSMERYLGSIPIKVHICLDQEGASGIEGEMVNLINSPESRNWLISLGIRKDIVSKIVGAPPIQRFYQIKQIEGVGEKSYERIFGFFYSRACNQDGSAIVRQLTLFKLS